MMLAVREMACACGELHHASLRLPCPALAFVPDAACVWVIGQGQAMGSMTFVRSISGVRLTVRQGIAQVLQPV